MTEDERNSIRKQSSGTAPETAAEVEDPTYKETAAEERGAAQDTPEVSAPHENRSAVRKRNWLIGGIAAAVVLVAALTITVFAVAGNTEKLLAKAWENTATVLEARSDTQPLNAIAAVMRADEGSRELSLSGKLGETGAGDFSLVLTGSNNRDLTAAASVAYGGKNVDATLYYDSDFVGIASKTLLGSGTAYGATPGSFAEQAKGGIFDPVTGQYPISADTLKELDEMFQFRDGGNLPFDAEDLKATAGELAEQYRAFVKSVKGKKSSGRVPEVGGKAKVLTYVYPAGKTFDLLQSLGDTFFASKGVQSYLAYLNTLDTAAKEPADLTDLQAKWNKALDDLRGNYTGDITVKYYIKDGKVVYLELLGDPTYHGRTVHGKLAINFGMTSGVLKAELTADDGSGKTAVSFSSEQTMKKGVAGDTWEISVKENDTAIGGVTGSSTWYSDTGALRFQIALQPQSGKKFGLTGDGTLKVSKKGFSLSCDKVVFTDNNGEETDFSAAVKYRTGVEVPKPAAEKNLFTLSADEFKSLILGLSTNADPILGTGAGKSVTGDLEAELTGNTAGNRAAADNSELQGAELLKASPIAGCTYMGKASCGGEEVLFPVCEDSQSFGDMITAYSGGVSFSVCTYPDMVGTAADTAAYLTDYWSSLSEQKDYRNVTVSEVAASGDRAARTASYEIVMSDGTSMRSTMAFFVEMRGTTAVATEISMTPDWAEETDKPLLAEFDKLAQMPLKAADLLS